VGAEEAQAMFDNYLGRLREKAAAKAAAREKEAAEDAEREKEYRWAERGVQGWTG